ncbi:DNA-binding response regulator, OmpR family, contains REC and winged-helix (wHTH) domain [Lacrimispora sphenoides]|jgi:DNA-binding response OmpR family regulator|uniref:response regulator transcription factor n=1 Tax=Lacrimispora sphenoides TaxID=29370 RepID=UPI0008C1BF75|nr:response regulator transcription factor [Lacrimispora sphenoides]SEU10540.1 DNA-binding response regulator, OmpR family, contains REC and winged-helix (wHTH) domain [Lacrimispora sphenoides]
MRLLLIEDDASLRDIIAKRLKAEGYTVDSCTDGESGYDYASGLEYDCVILDIMLPKLSGLEVLKRLRSEGNKSNILLLTAKDSIEDRVAGLNAGADDYLVKPFAFEELLARIRTIMRRTGESRDNLLALEDLLMDVNEHSVTRAGKRIELTSKEYALLEYLMRNQGRVLTRTQLSDHVWNNEFEYDSNIVDVYIRYLRNKIDKAYGLKLLQTIRGVGYSLRCKE